MRDRRFNGAHRRAWRAAAMLGTLVVAGCSSPEMPFAPVASTRTADAGRGADASPGPGASAPDGGGAEASAPVDPRAAALHAHADEALETLMLAYWSKLAANTTTIDWMFPHYWEALLDAAERHGPNAFAGSVRMFYDLEERRGWLNDYYDDENWIELALLHSFAFTGETLYLDEAKYVFDDIMLAADDTCCGSDKGGLWWRKSKDAKVTAINGGAVISAAHLYEYTGDAKYLTFATKTYAYWSTHMVDPATGHVYDGIGSDGTINKAWSFTYSEGLMIGAAVALAKVTGKSSYLDDAHRYAAYMLSHEIETTPLGTILSDGACSGDGEMFKAAGARALLELYRADLSHVEYREILVRSADAAWSLARDPATGNISCDWKGPYDASSGRVGSLGSAAVAMAAAAKALGVAPQRPTLAYEVEEGNLHALGLEATHGGFSGWGYVAGWGSDGQSVDLLVNAPTAGDYTTELQYATGDAATRKVAANGTTVFGNLPFASTGGYDSYASVTVTIPLLQGRNVVTFAYDAALGSAGYINLDRAVFRPKN